MEVLRSSAHTLRVRYPNTPQQRFEAGFYVDPTNPPQYPIGLHFGSVRYDQGAVEARDGSWANRTEHWSPHTRSWFLTNRDLNCNVVINDLDQGFRLRVNAQFGGNDTFLLGNFNCAMPYWIRGQFVMRTGIFTYFNVYLKGRISGRFVDHGSPVHVYRMLISGDGRTWSQPGGQMNVIIGANHLPVRASWYTPGFVYIPCLGTAPYLAVYSEPEILWAFFGVPGGDSTTYPFPRDLGQWCST